MRTTYETVEGKTIAIGEISSLPGCSQIGVFHSSFVLPEYRNKGFGIMAHRNRLDVASALLYDYALCTVQSDNTPQIKILNETGWTQFAEFPSRKTGHIVYLYGRPIT